MAALGLLASRHVGEIDEGTVEVDPHRRKNVLAAPQGADRLDGEVGGRLATVAFDMAVHRREVGAKVGEDFAQCGLSELGDVEGAEARSSKR